MSLIAYVRQNSKPASNVYKELSLIGMLNTEPGDAVIEISKILQAVDISTHPMILKMALQLAENKPLSPIYHPVKHNEFVITGIKKDGLMILQSTRLPSLFSDDGGMNWYDIDIKPSFRWFWSYLNKNIFIKPGRIKNLIKKRLLYYVDFPYEQDCIRGKAETT